MELPKKLNICDSAMQIGFASWKRHKSLKTKRKCVSNLVTSNKIKDGIWWNDNCEISSFHLQFYLLGKFCGQHWRSYNKTAFYIVHVTKLSCSWSEENLIIFKRRNIFFISTQLRIFYYFLLLVVSILDLVEFQSESTAHLRDVSLVHAACSLEMNKLVNLFALIRLNVISIAQKNYSFVQL